MRRLALLAAALLLGSAATPSAAPGHQTLGQLNAWRAAGLPCPDGPRPATRALTWNDALSRAARQQASHLASSGQVTHTGPDGEGPQERARRMGVRADHVAEIVYLGQRRDPWRALTWWKQSAVHCRIMTDARYGQAGASVVTGPRGQAVVVVLSGAEP